MSNLITGDADIDFMKQMRTHHEAAIDMAKVVLANGKDVDTKKLAQEIIAAQEKEIATIDAWFKRSIVNRSYRRILVTGASGGGFGACLDRPRETRRPFAPRIQGFKPLPGAGRASLDSTGMHF